MTRRSKLELEINKPVNLELLYDDPIVGESNYGPYFMYAVSLDGIEYSFFAPEEVHNQLSKLSKGDKATVTKIAAQRGAKLVTKYDVRAEGKVAPKAQMVSVDEIIEDILPEGDDQDDHDQFFQVMKQSYLDALKINSDLNGMADPAKIAITLFIARSKSI
jgi:hypothetical protein